MKKKRYVVIPALFLLLLWGMTAITHTYGPYMGKVVEAKTGEPVEGAVVFLLFTTWTGNFGGTRSSYADAVEVLTDKNGEFAIPKHRIKLVRFNQGWSEYGYVKIFKPGYGVFPDHRDSGPHYKIGYTLPENTYWTVMLPKLRYEERLDNLSNLYIPRSDQIPLEKKRILLRLKNIENNFLGLKPSRI